MLNAEKSAAHLKCKGHIEMMGISIDYNVKNLTLENTVKKKKKKRSVLVQHKVTQSV